MGLRRARASSSPDPSELLSISDRATHLVELRVGLSVIVIGAAAIWPELASASLGWLWVTAGAYLCAHIGLLAIIKQERRVALPALQAGLLLDGIFLATVVASTGGASNPLRILLYGHVVGVTLLCSYRTGLKFALWNTLLFLLMIQAIDADIAPAAWRQGAGGSDGDAALTVVGIWFLALGAAAFSAASERQLRRQKADLADLSAMITRIDGSVTSGENRGIPNILLDQLCRTFGFVRGVVLASPEGELELLAATATDGPTILTDGMDPLMTRAWAKRAPQLVREIDPSTDPRLASLLPDARDVMVVPLFLVGGHRLGIVVIERGRAAAPMHRWEVDLVGQFTAHAALALYNAWLTEEKQEQLETIRGLEHRLRAHNAELEVMVDERTEELRRVIVDLEETDRQRRRLLHHVVRVAEDERLRIAHDVHDDPVQKLVVVKMRLEMLAAEHPELSEIVDARETVSSTIRSMRRMLFELSPPILDEEGLGPALEYFLQNSPVSYRWSVRDELDTQPSKQTRLMLYRTAQEALTNTRKHANATNVRVTLEQRDGGVQMEIEDDGDGFEPQNAIAAPGHLGLAAMRERTEMAGGACTLRSLPGAGTSLEVWLPNEPQAPGHTDETDAKETVLALQERIA